MHSVRWGTSSPKLLKRNTTAHLPCGRVLSRRERSCAPFSLREKVADRPDEGEVDERLAAHSCKARRTYPSICAAVRVAASPSPALRASSPGGRGFTLAAKAQGCAIQVFENGLEVGENFVIPIARDDDSSLRKRRRSCCVVTTTVGRVVPSAVEFHGPMQFVTIEIEDVRIGGMLPAELEAGKSSAAQYAPDKSFGIGLATA